MPELPDQYEPKRPTAEMQLADGVKTKLVAESVELANGEKSNRAMVRITFGF